MSSSDYMIGNCAGCHTFPTVLFKVPSAWTEYRFRCASCFKTDVGHEHPNASVILHNFRVAVEGPEAVEPVGEITPRGSLFMSFAVGDAKDENDKYILAASVTSYAPQVTSEKTGKTFSMRWQDIVKLAIREGVSRDS